MLSYAENTKLDRANKPTFTLYLVFLLSTKWNKTCTYVYTRNSKFKTNWKMVKRFSFFAREKSCLAWAMSEPELLPEWWTGLSYYPGTPIVAEELCWFIQCLPIIHSHFGFDHEIHSVKIDQCEGIYVVSLASVNYYQSGRTSWSYYPSALIVAKEPCWFVYYALIDW